MRSPWLYKCNGLPKIHMLNSLESYNLNFLLINCLHMDCFKKERRPSGEVTALIQHDRCLCKRGYLHTQEDWHINLMQRSENGRHSPRHPWGCQKWGVSPRNVFLYLTQKKPTLLLPWCPLRSLQHYHTINVLLKPSNLWQVVYLAAFKMHWKWYLKVIYFRFWESPLMKGSFEFTSHLAKAKKKSWQKEKELID